ncbi:hypothetical protein [Tunturiibacter gelidiferens]|uniref:hypothetical protein n=1 Tax=Tunturiibacter gelidiferens TaxID=3069689 RepID=UPI003D9B376E
MNDSAAAILPLSWLSLIFSAILASSGFAQTTPAKSASCKIDRAAPTETELAFYRENFKKAAELAAAEYKADAKNSRSRQLEIDSLIGQGKLDDARKKPTHGPSLSQQILSPSSPPENSATQKETGWSPTPSCSRR